MLIGAGDQPAFIAEDQPLQQPARGGDFVGAREELIECAKGDEHRQEKKPKGDDLHEFLPVQVVEDGYKQDGIDQYMDQFLPGHILDVGAQISNDGEKRERQNGPTNGRPEQLRAGIQP